jgi:hypothetical protein
LKSAGVLEHQGFAVEGFGLVLHGGVRHDDADAFHVQFGVAEGLEETHPRLGHQEIRAALSRWWP